MTRYYKMLEGNGLSSFKVVLRLKTVFTEPNVVCRFFEDHIAKLVIVLTGDECKIACRTTAAIRHSLWLTTEESCDFTNFWRIPSKIGIIRKILLLLPYTYDFTDFGKGRLRCMFVISSIGHKRVIAIASPYLYKILADEFGASCWLSLAPNHIYIKTGVKIGWYNTELTSGTFRLMPG